MATPSTSRFRWGVLGTGTIAAKFAVQLAKVQGAELHAVASASQARAEQFAKAHGFTRALSPHAALLEDGQVDAVYIATPTRDHLAHCTLALQADKAVLCEKPLALDAAQGARIASLAAERGVFCMEAMWMRFHPLVQQLRGWVHSGRLGEIHHVHAELGWRKDPARVEDPQLGRGAALDFGVYPLSFVHYLLGAPAEVRVATRKHASGVDETVAAQLVYPTCSASIAASVATELSNGANVAGSLGSAFLGQPLQSPRSLTLVEHGRPPSPSERLLRAIGPVFSGLGAPSAAGLRLQAEELMRCVREGRLQSEVVPLGASLEVLRQVDLLRA